MRKYKFLGFLKSISHIFLLSDPDKNIPLYIGKISKPSNGFTDLDNRHSIVQKLGDLLGILIPEFHNCNGEDIINLEELYNKMPSFKYLTGMSVCDYLGPTIDEFLAATGSDIGKIRNHEIIWEGIAFNLWVGNHDRKIKDYLVDHEQKVWFIDYDLSGIGFEDPGQSECSLGYAAEPYEFYVPDIRFCLDCDPLFLFDKFLEYPREQRFNLVKPMIDKIKNLKNERIEEAVKSSDLFRRNSDKKIKINKEYYEVLLKRRDCLEDVIKHAFGFLP